MINHHFRVEVMPPKNGKPGCIAVTDDWATLEAAIEVSDAEEAVGRKIAALMTRLQPRG